MVVLRRPGSDLSVRAQGRDALPDCLCARIFQRYDRRHFTHLVDLRRYPCINDAAKLVRSDVDA